ncbi:MAG: hypothetical protein JXA66_02035 [Oligoflexia bacterium]|nr:hypothetical protein [Oligoflexia bacterium]
MDLDIGLDKKTGNGSSLAGKTVYIPGMDYAGSRIFASVFKSMGVNAVPNVNSDSRTLELGSKYTSGEECLPERVTIGDFMKVVLSPEFDAEKSVFFMPVSNGPCRFGQYAPYFRLVLKRAGFDHVNVYSPSGEDGYGGLADDSITMLRKTWLCLISSDILRKMLHKVRPYEKMQGTTDKVFERAIERMEYVFSRPGRPFVQTRRDVLAALGEIRYEFSSIPADYCKERPLVGVVGEIFCRLNEFSNNDLIRHVEELGGECWLSDICEWVWYTNYEEKKNLNYAGRRYSMGMLVAKAKHFIQHRDEKMLYGVFKNEFKGYEELETEKLMDIAKKYLHPLTAIGEMILSVGKAIHLYNKGADGIIDISPFSCMNGIVSEGVYPLVSRDHDNFPIKSLYFDGSSNTSIERDLPLFMEMVRGYMNRKNKLRVYPGYFG